MMATQIPEIQRVPLEQLVLQLMAIGLGDPEAFMERLLQPPTVAPTRMVLRPRRRLHPASIGWLVRRPISLPLTDTERCGQLQRRLRGRKRD